VENMTTKGKARKKERERKNEKENRRIIDKKRK
jgi:hypothetical protein